VYDGLPLTDAFVKEVLRPLGGRLLLTARGVTHGGFPLAAGLVHSHVLLMGDDLEQFLHPFMAEMLARGERVYHLEHDLDRREHDVVDALLNRFYHR